MIFGGFHLECREKDGGTTRPLMKDFGAIALPIFHSRLEAWKFLRSWSGGETTKELRKKGYRCVQVKIERRWHDKKDKTLTIGEFGGSPLAVRMP